MSDARRARATYAGVYLARGVLMYTDHIGEAEARRRVIAHWTAGARCYRWRNRLALLWPHARQLDARCAPGSLVIETAHGLTTLPAGPHETLARAGAVCVMLDSQVAYLELSAASEVDPSQWVDPGHYVLAAAQAWPEGNASVAVRALEPVGTARELLGDAVPKPAAAALALKRKLLDQAARNSQRSAVAGTQGPIETPRQSAFGRWLHGILERSVLGDMAARAQARYLRRLLRMLEAADLDQALRHALPLDNASAGEQRAGFATPRPRKELAISAHKGPSSPLLVGGPDIYAALRQHYRAAVDRLKQLGRIKEAVFVLVELLNVPEEGVALLEQAQQLREAAQLAESCDLAVGLVVRQWFIAGDRERAVAIARRRNGFQDAVLRLEQGHRPEAAVLRLLWAESLASAGEYERAVQTIWPIESARNVAREWIGCILDSGGDPAARILVQHVVLDRAALPDVLPLARRLLDDTDPVMASERAAFGKALITYGGSKPSPELQLLARLACRATIRDLAAGSTELAHRDCARLATLSGDALLHADLPPLANLAHLTPRPDTAGQGHLRIPAGDVGTLSIEDAVLLPGGRTLVALGDLGVRLLTRDGRTIAYFDVPAQALVISDAGTRAIALARRGNLFSLACLALDRRTSRHWGDIALDTWSSTFDGSTWFAAHRDTLYAFDTLKESPEAWWRVSSVSNDGGYIRALRREDSRLRLVAGADATECWNYELPDLVLRDRATITASDGQPFAAVYPMQDLGGSRLLGSRILDNDNELVMEAPALDLPPELQGEPWTFALGTGTLTQAPLLADTRVILALESDDTGVVVMFAIGDCGDEQRVEFTDAPAPRIRVQGTQVLAHDAHGRLTVLDAASGSVVRSLRV